MNPYVLKNQHTHFAYEQDRSPWDQLVDNVFHIAYAYSIVLQEVVFSKYTLSSQMYLFCFY
jgi:hypothetical protein